MAKVEVLNVPPVQAVRSFRAKGMHVGFDWRDTDARQHATSFTVAKAMRVDVLHDIREAVDEAIAEGTSFRNFAARLEPKLVEKGWWGRALETDPKTGQTRIVQLGSPRRLRIIYNTNVRMSIARGRWERIERVAERRPYLRYVATLDEATRPDHRAWHGTVLRWDHEFWQSHYPPNGWKCRCTVQQYSERDLKRHGHAVSGAPPAAWNSTRSWKNGRTGRIVQVPRGIDPGFQHNAGLVAPESRAREILAEKARALPAAQRRAVLDGPAAPAPASEPPAPDVHQADMRQAMGARFGSILGQLRPARAQGGRAPQTHRRGVRRAQRLHPRRLHRRPPVGLPRHQLGAALERPRDAARRPPLRAHHRRRPRQVPRPQGRRPARLPPPQGGARRRRPLDRGRPNPPTRVHVDLEKRGVRGQRPDDDPLQIR